MWLSKRQILAWLKHKTSNLTDGKINTAANVVNKQLLDEVEHDIMNYMYQNRGLCYLPKPKAEADNTDTRF